MSKNMIILKFAEVKKEISKIAAIENSDLCQEEIKKLDRKLHAAKIKKVKRGNYYYFYEIEYYFDKIVQHSRERVIENLGRIETSDYDRDKSKIDRMKKSELKNYLEQY